MDILNPEIPKLLVKLTAEQLVFGYDSAVYAILKHNGSTVLIWQSYISDWDEPGIVPDRSGIEPGVFGQKTMLEDFEPRHYGRDMKCQLTNFSNLVNHLKKANIIVEETNWKELTWEDKKQYIAAVEKEQKLEISDEDRRKKYIYVVMQTGVKAEKDWLSDRLKESERITQLRKVSSEIIHLMPASPKMNPFLFETVFIRADNSRVGLGPYTVLLCTRFHIPEGTSSQKVLNYINSKKILEYLESKLMFGDTGDQVILGNGKVTWEEIKDDEKLYDAFDDKTTKERKDFIYFIWGCEKTGVSRSKKWKVSGSIRSSIIFV